MAAGDLTTWESAPGEVCMRWGDRFQACDTISTNPPPAIGLTPDSPPPQPLSLPRDTRRRTADEGDLERLGPALD